MVLRNDLILAHRRCLVGEGELPAREPDVDEVLRPGRIGHDKDEKDKERYGADSAS